MAEPEKDILRGSVLLGGSCNDILHRHREWETVRLPHGHEYMVTAVSISPTAPRTSENLRN